PATSTSSPHRPRPILPRKPATGPSRSDLTTHIGAVVLPWTRQALAWAKTKASCSRLAHSLKRSQGLPKKTAFLVAPRWQRACTTCILSMQSPSPPLKMEQPPQCPPIVTLVLTSRKEGNDL